VITRDGGVCRITGQPAESIHHIVYRSHGGNNTSYNLICLSNKQHERVHNNGKKWFKILFKMQQEIYPNLTKDMMKK
jgi:5-methylcytosine-specific restriction endonuclease McrA